MSKIYASRTSIVVRLFSLITAMLFMAPQGFAQAPLTPCNVPTSLSSVGINSAPGTIVTGASWTGASGLASLSLQGNATDNNAANFATFNTLLLSTIRLTVESTGGYYAAGTYAGFDIQSTGGLLDLDLLGSVTIKTYLGTTLQEQATLGAGTLELNLLSATGKQRAGFRTTKNFDRIMIEQFSTLSLGSNLQVYGAVVERYCAGAAPACNTNQYLTTPAYPVSTEAGSTALLGVNSSVNNPEFAIDADLTNYATIVQTVGVAANAQFEIKDEVTMYNNTFAGFDIENPSLLNLGLLGNMTVAVYRNDTLVQSVTGNGLLALNTGLLNSTGRQIIGFVPTGQFNSVRLTINQTLAADLGTTRIYGAILKQFCANDITCAQSVGLKNTANPDYPVFVNARRTGVTGTGCVSCAINNTNNLIDGNSSTFATIDLTAGVLSTGSIAVKNQLQDYPAGSYAGFEIESTTLLAANVVGNIKFKLYKDDVLVQDGTGQPLLAGVSTDILTGGTSPKQIVGIISNVAFDEVVMEVNNLIAANVLGTINVYETYIETSCARNVPCNTSEVLSQTQHGAVVNGANTGVSGAVCAGCKVDDPWNAVSATNTDFSRLYNTVNALSTTSLGVAVPQYVYPAGTFAGFVIKRNNFAIAASLLPNITISTYNNGVLQETNTGSNLLNLSVLVNLIGSDTNVYNAGFITTMPFDEIKISMNTLVTALDQYIDIYGAFVDTRFLPAGTPGTTCNFSRPDFNVGYINQAIPGNVKTNDVVTGTTTYAAAVALSGNPAAALPSVNADGTYTFTTATAGVYQFNVPVCDNSVCINQLLTITVKDQSVLTSAPVINTDIASVKMGQSVIIHSLANDYAGTGGSALVPASITLTDMNGATAGNTVYGGTAVANTTNGNVTYTPAAGFIGIDTIHYNVCDNQTSAQCGGAYQIVTVLPTTYTNSTLAADDYIQTKNGDVLTTTAANGVLANDSDPDDDAQTVTAKTETIVGKGILVLAADGSYTFTPLAGYVGPVDFTYVVTDNATTPATASATLHILVEQVPDLTMSTQISASNFIISSGTSANFRLRVSELQGVPTNNEASPVYVRLSKNSAIYSYTFDPTLTTMNFPAATTIDNTKWELVTNSATTMLFKLKAGENISAYGLSSIGVTMQVLGTATISQLNITPVILNNSGGERNSTNNSSVRKVNVQ